MSIYQYPSPISPCSDVPLSSRAVLLSRPPFRQYAKIHERPNIRHQEQHARNWNEHSGIPSVSGKDMSFIRKNSGIVATSPINPPLWSLIRKGKGHLPETRVTANAPQPYRFNMTGNNLTDLPTSPIIWRSHERSGFNWGASKPKIPAE